MAQTLYDGVHETCIAYVAKATKSLSKHTMAGGKVNVKLWKIRKSTQTHERQNWIQINNHDSMKFCGKKTKMNSRAILNLY